jgi:hypothetical protein
MRMTLKIFFVFLFLSLLIIRPTPSYAFHGRGHFGISLGLWPGSYYYGGPYYPYYPYYADPYYADPYYAQPGYRVVSSSSYQPVVVNGTTYYLNNGVYYIYTQYGYQAVATPVGATVSVAQPATVTATPASTGTDDSFTINIPDNKGGYTSVLLKKSGNGFIGPQGEFYPEFPKVSQLKVIYGK